MQAELLLNCNRETLTGVVIPETWDENYAVISVFLSCQGEREVLISNLEHFPALLSMSQQEIIVTGVINKGSKKETIDIESIAIPKSKGF